MNNSYSQLIKYPAGSIIYSSCEFCGKSFIKFKSGVMCDDCKPPIYINVVIPCINNIYMCKIPQNHRKSLSYNKLLDIISEQINIPSNKIKIPGQEYTNECMICPEDFPDVIGRIIVDILN